MISWIVVLAGLLTIAASVLYVRATIMDTAQPEIVSWLAWAALLAESTVAEFRAMAIPAALYTGICGLACGLIAVLSLVRRGSWEPSRLDLFSLTAAAAGVILLVVVHSNRAVVAVTVLADLAAYLPTMVHAWQAPDEEPALVYALFGAGAALTLWSADRTLVAAAYPFYLTAADILVVLFIVYRRRQDRAELAELFRPGRPLSNYGR